MKREYLFSIIFHLFFLALMLVSSPFDPQAKPMPDVIRVSLTSGPPVASVAEPAPLPPLETPPPVVAEELPDIPIDDPTTMKKAIIEKSEPVKEPDKPKPKPKKAEGTRPRELSAAELAAQAEGSEIESSATAAGSPFAGATVDNASFQYPYWFNQAFNKISRNWRNPVAYDGTLVCVIYFQVIQSGRVLDIEVESSSGIEQFDEACLSAVRRSAPFPPLPKDYRDEIIGLTLPFKYEPR